MVRRFEAVYGWKTGVSQSVSTQFMIVTRTLFSYIVVHFLVQIEDGRDGGSIGFEDDDRNQQNVGECTFV